jgi:hypothetical protein
MKRWGGDAERKYRQCPSAQKMFLEEFERHLKVALG